MLYSDDRMKYIIEYLSAYKQKIELANKNGLLDNAKMFELFAEQVCKLYYNMEFHNLNNICNFPYFDLISEDKSIYVQVSTISDVHQKIRSEEMIKLIDSRKLIVHIFLYYIMIV